MEWTQPPGQLVMTMPHNREDFDRGLDLFNRAHFFDAHEVLEDLWRAAPRGHSLRRHLQGMVQLAVAFHHQSTGNYVGARSVLERALTNLHGADSSFPDLDLDRLRTESALWQRYLDDAAAVGKIVQKLDERDLPRRAVPALPQITLRRYPDTRSGH